MLEKQNEKVPYYERLEWIFRRYEILVLLDNKEQALELA